MKKKSGGGSEMKSAVEIAMARFAGKGGEAELTEEQKEAIGEAERELKAKIAELEIMTAQRVGAARAGGDQETAERLAAEKAGETARLRRLCDRKKKKIRQAGDGP